MAPPAGRRTGAGSGSEDGCHDTDPHHPHTAHGARRPCRRGGRRGAVARALCLAQGAAPIQRGFQLHRTGIGAAHGRWYECTTQGALKLVNEAGGIDGRPVEILFEDDGNDPRRGAAVVEKRVSQSGCDVIFGPLFSHVVIATAPRAGALKVPHLVCSEGFHVASGMLNRWTLQPGITDVRAQVSSMAPG
jgi:branched-chain amino acid transport system substrate-binding protein